MATKNKTNEYIFRIDDVSINSDPNKVKAMVSLLLKKYKNSSILIGISALVSDLTHSNENQERVFPSIWKALSDYSVFYCVDKCGIPIDLLVDLQKEFKDKIITAGHGLIHVDHRLLSEEAQTMSIVASCSLAKSDVFIPPFNKWNAITEYICEKYKITLIKFESGWKHLSYNKVTSPGLYYFHSHDFNSIDEFAKQI